MDVHVARKEGNHKYGQLQSLVGKGIACWTWA